MSISAYGAMLFLQMLQPANRKIVGDFPRHWRSADSLIGVRRIEAFENLLTDAESAENEIENIVCINRTNDLAQSGQGLPDLSGH